MQPTLASKIRTARETQGLKQDDIANALCVSQPLVSRWEKGKAHPGEHLGRLAELLKVDLFALVDLQLEICTETERAIVADKQLTRRDQDTLLAAYGVLTQRNSLDLASVLRTHISPGDSGGTDSDK